MDVFSFLETTAEISIAFAGFISIFFVLARRDGSFEPAVALQIWVILSSAISVLFYAALPLLLAGLGMPDIAVWRASGAIAFVSGTLVTARIIARRRRTPDVRITPILWITRSLNAFALLLHLLNAVGWPFAPSGGVYLACVWLALAGDAVVETIALLDIGSAQGALRKVFVRPDFRGAAPATAKRLLDVLTDWSAERGFREIFLGTSPHLPAARRFYARHGFDEIAMEALPPGFPSMEVDTKFYRRGC